MRGILTARNKPLEVINTEEEETCNIKSKNYDLPKAKGDCKFFEKENISILIQELKTNATIK